MSLAFEDIDEFHNYIESFIVENLIFDAETTSHYVGDMGGGESLYKDSTVVRVLLRDKRIGEFYV